jgi:1-deoxy-D-xylulose-5-phosphate reductoisomerase
MVEFVDGTVLAQLGVTDMRLPIQYALSYPERWPAAIPGMDFSGTMRLDFEQPDRERFPCLGLAYEALRRGGSVPAVLNAANEEAVAAFLDERIPFTAIPETIAAVMEACPGGALVALDDVLKADAWARTATTEILQRHVRDGARQ